MHFLRPWWMFWVMLKNDCCSIFPRAHLISVFAVRTLSLAAGSSLDCTQRQESTCGFVFTILWLVRISHIFEWYLFFEVITSYATLMMWAKWERGVTSQWPRKLDQSWEQEQETHVKRKSSTTTTIHYHTGNNTKLGEIHECAFNARNTETAHIFCF